MSKLKKYIITSAQYGAQPHKELLKNFELLAKREKAEIIVLPLEGCYKDDMFLNPTLEQYNIITGKHKLNDNIQITAPWVKPQTVDPIAGLGRLTQGDVTSIFASPKQRLKPFANGQDLPKILMTTGACTHPYYKMNTKMGRVAEHDHVYGGIFVEIKDNKFYQFRNLTATKNGVFYDICDKVGNGKIQRTRPPIFRPGDWHTGLTDPVVRTEIMRMLDLYNPKEVFFEDFMDSKSISHHEEGKLLAKVHTLNTRGLSLEDELYDVACELKTFAEKWPHIKFNIIKSNHDEHINQWLTECRFVKEPQNALIGSKLLTAALEGKDPLVAGIEMFYDIPKNVEFFTRDMDYFVCGIQCARHGDERVSGGRGSRASIEIANSNCFVGHGHSLEWLRDVFAVGTCTYTDPAQVDYITGYGSWTNTSGFGYSNGKKQTVNIINGLHRFGRCSVKGK